MKKIIVLSAVSTLLLSAVSAIVYVNNDKDAMDDLFDANVEALVQNELGGYPCPGACLTWTGSTGGGIDCLCKRYVGRCKKWCD